MSEPTGAWGLPLEGALCPHCDWRYFLPEGALPLRCPHCWRADLVPLAEPSQLPYNYPPELVVPFSLKVDAAAARIAAFAKGIPFAPEDLNPQTLRRRVQRLFVPQWLVDGDVTALWEAEAGFDYEVVSHQDRYADGSGWSTREVRETRVRWEPRVGRLARTYANVIAPALDAEAALKQRVGAYSGAAQPYAPARIDGMLVRLPDRAPGAAWSDAAPAFHAVAAEECRQACEADHIRQFRWSPEYGALTWTLRLLPVYATYYLDDEGHPCPVLLNGQTGQISGLRRGSMQRAQRWSLIIVAVAAVLFVLSLIAGLIGIAVPPLLVLAGIGGLIALGVGLCALIPIVRVWQFNRKTQLSPSS